MAVDTSRVAVPRSGTIERAEYWTRKGSVPLYLYRKRIVPPDGRPQPVFFLVHGSSFSGRTTFDLSVPGRDDYSMMDVFARQGFDVWTMDHEGYGRSGRTDGNSDIACGAEDLAAAADVVERESGAGSYAFYGSSSGALRAALFAQRHPRRVERLVLDAFVWTGEGAPTLEKRRQGLELFRSQNRRPADRDLFRSIFTRDHPGTSESIVADAIADAEMAFGDSVPTGTYLDMVAHLPVVEPERIEAAVQIIRAEFDGIATESDLLAFFAKLPNKDKQFVFLPGTSHVSLLGVNRRRFYHAVLAFLTIPPRRDAI